MRKVKLKVQCDIPSWGYCNYDGFTANDRYSKELCRFCVKTKTGHHCLLFDQDLAADPRFVHKAAGCVDASATSGYEVSTPPAVEPKLIMSETLKSYRKTVADLMKQGYPRGLAESLATKYILDEK